MTEGLLLVDGRWQRGRGATFESINPANGRTVWSGSAATTEDVAAAVDAARCAVPDWAARPLDERVGAVTAFREAVRSSTDDLANAITAETGKPRWETAGEVAAAAAKVDISIAAHTRRTGTTTSEAPGGRSVVRHKPHGVLGVFGPYNFPAHLPNGHIVPALIAGNCVVFKPSELTPMVGEMMVRIWDGIGLPPGVVNLVQGARDTGAALAGHEGIDGLLFTGSATTGAYLHEQFGGRPDKILALEMGGNNPLIVAEDADVEAAVYHTIQSAFLSSGQRCTCARRLLVPDGPWGDSFLGALAAATRSIVVGPPDAAEQPFMGPLISVRAADGLLAAQAALEAAGGAVVVRMERLQHGPAYLSPGIVDVTGVEVPDEEYFGPLLSVVRYANVDEAIAIANNTRFGLAAGIFTDDRSMYERFWASIRAGVVNWNRPLTGASSGAPFGGIGASGNHRPSAYYAADYVAYPVSSLEADSLALPDSRAPGLG